MVARYIRAVTHQPDVGLLVSVGGSNFGDFGLSFGGLSFGSLRFSGVSSTVATSWTVVAIFFSPFQRVELTVLLHKPEPRRTMEVKRANKMKGVQRIHRP